MVQYSFNYAWAMPEATDLVQLAHWNNFVSGVDTQLKAIENSHSPVIPYIAEFEMYPSTPGASQEYVSHSTSMSAFNFGMRWRKVWDTRYANAGGFQTNANWSHTEFQFTATGHYRLSYHFGIEGQATTNTTIRLGLYNRDTAAEIAGSVTESRGNTYNAIQNIHHIGYYKVTSSGGTIDVNDSLYFRVEWNASNSGSMRLKVDDDEKEWRPRVQVEFVRPL